MLSLWPQIPNFIIFFKESGYQNIPFICFTQFLQAHMLTFKKARFLREGTLFLPQNESNLYFFLKEKPVENEISLYQKAQKWTPNLISHYIHTSFIST